MRRPLLVLGLAALIGVLLGAFREGSPPAAREEVLAAGRPVPLKAPPAAPVTGKALYEQKCAHCHGLAGKGDGPLGKLLDPPPRDFTAGSYKFRSTPFGSLPTDEDLRHTLLLGIPGSGMPPWRHLPDKEMAALLAYIKQFSPRFASEKPEPPIPLPDPPPLSPERAARGKKVYEAMQCAKCHGVAGKGDGEAAPELVDDEERPIKPADLTLGIYKSGGTDRDLYRTITTGINGTPMPSYGDTITPEERWDLIEYLRTLAR